MNLMHYAKQPITFDSSRTYEQREPNTTFRKPEGFWVSVAGEDDWPSWCRGEDCFLDSLTAAHRVTLKPSAAVVFLKSAFELDAFTGAYAVQTDWERRWSWRVTDSRKWPIDWREVVKDCDGLIITPYQWDRRAELDWYYGWDCASGCIWNLDAIESVELIASEVTA